MDKVVARAGASGSTSEQPSHAAVHTVRRNRSGPVILLCCVVLALMVVLAAPLLAGGAAVVPVSSQESQIQYYSVSQPFPSVEAAAAELGFTPQAPAALPEGYVQDGIAVLDGAVFEQVYKNGKDTIVYRMAAGSDDLTYTDTAYQYSATQDAGGVSRTYEGGSDKKLNICVWCSGEYSYALVSPDGISADSMHQMAESVA